MTEFLKTLLFTALAAFFLSVVASVLGIDPTDFIAYAALGLSLDAWRKTP